MPDTITIDTITMFRFGAWHHYLCFDVSVPDTITIGTIDDVSITMFHVSVPDTITIDTITMFRCLTPSRLLLIVSVPGTITFVSVPDTITIWYHYITYSFDYGA